MPRVGTHFVLWQSVPHALWVAEDGLGWWPHAVKGPENEVSAQPNRPPPQPIPCWRATFAIQQKNGDSGSRANVWNGAVAVIELLAANDSRRLNAGARVSPLSGGSVEPHLAAGHGLRHRARSCHTAACVGRQDCSGHRHSRTTASKSTSSMPVRSRQWDSGKRPDTFPEVFNAIRIDLGLLRLAPDVLNPVEITAQRSHHVAVDGAIEDQFVEHRQTLCVRPAVATGTVFSDGGKHISHRDDV